MKARPTPDGSPARDWRTTMTKEQETQILLLIHRTRRSLLEHLRACIAPGRTDVDERHDTQTYWLARGLAHHAISTHQNLAPSRK